MNILEKNYLFKFQFSNGLKSFNDQQRLNIFEKLVPLDTFQFSNGLIFFNNEQSLKYMKN